MRAIDKERWCPSSNLSLEPNALTVAKSNVNYLVVAGPGAGKTELLAQRASYLLQTNSCKFPHKILAISFKKDAAYNLKKRVVLRCGEELSRRFDSLTFDSFAKQIVDRFKSALPSELQFNNDYDILIGDTEVLDMYNMENLTYSNTTSKIALMNFHNTIPFPYSITTDQEKIKQNVWRKLLKAEKAKLTFPMIMRLAVIIIEANPKIKKYLQQAYHFVFLDEFQDTTTLQYEFFKSCFLGSSAIYTAVGDDKQRIMLWAGAKKTVFEDFIEDTGAKRIPLNMNFRSAPRLVALQNHLIQHLLGKTDFAKPSDKWKKESGECFVWFFENPQIETQILFDNIQKWIVEEGVNPRDICILVKQQLNKYVGNLIDFFNNNGIKARDENVFQNLLSEDLPVFVINLLYCVYKEKPRVEKTETIRFLSSIHTELEDTQLLELENELAKFTKIIFKKYTPTTLTDIHISNLVDEIIHYADKEKILSTYPIYKNQAFFDGIVTDLKQELSKCYSVCSDLVPALDIFIGKDTIPVMTVHKSKGLEYHTVIFVGLEDGAFWSFQQQPDEDKCTFFVAISRAKERVVFTFSKLREGRYGLMQGQNFDQIEIIFKELETSGIAVIEEKP